MAIRGQVRINQRALDRKLADPRPEVTDALRESAMPAETDLVVNTPVQTGRLRASARAQVRQNTLLLGWFGPEYGPYVEERLGVIASVLRNNVRPLVQNLDMGLTRRLRRHG